MRTEKIKIYQFQELNEEAKKKAIEHFFYTNVECDDWWSFVYENFKEENKHFEVDKIYFSGFYSQGDGAMFEYSGVSQELINKAIESLNLPTWKKNVLKKCIYVTASGKHSGHYYHEKSIKHSIWIESDTDHENITELIDNHSEDIEEYIIDFYEELACNLYSYLRKEYEYLTSEEYIIESIEANEYEFLENGEVSRF